MCAHEFLSHVCYSVSVITHILRLTKDIYVDLEVKACTELSGTIFILHKCSLLSLILFLIFLHTSGALSVVGLSEVPSFLIPRGYVYCKALLFVFSRCTHKIYLIAHTVKLQG